MTIFQQKWISVFTLIFFSGLMLFLSNCANKEEASKVQPNYTSLYTEVFSKRCIECHRPSGAATVAGSQLDFSSATLGYTTFVNQVVRGGTSLANCNNAKMVGTSTSNSYVLAIFFDEYGRGTNNWGGITGCTPLDHTAYQNSTPSSSTTANEKSALVQWISGGAPNN